MLLRFRVVLEEGEGFFIMGGRLVNLIFHRFLQSFKGLRMDSNVLRNIFHFQGESCHGGGRAH